MFHFHCESRYSKEEGIALSEYHEKNFTFLLKWVCFSIFLYAVKFKLFTTIEFLRASLSLTNHYEYSIFLFVLPTEFWHKFLELVISVTHLHLTSVNNKQTHPMSFVLFMSRDLSIKCTEDLIINILTWITIE